VCTKHQVVENAGKKKYEEEIGEGLFTGVACHLHLANEGADNIANGGKKEAVGDSLVDESP
jgi:hypothetical protein